MVKQKETNPFSGLSDKLRTLRDERLVHSSRIVEIDAIVTTVTESLNGAMPEPKTHLGRAKSPHKGQKSVYLGGDAIVTPFKGLFLGSRYVYHAGSYRLAHIGPGGRVCALRPFFKTKKVMISIYPDNRGHIASWLGEKAILTRADDEGSYVLISMDQIRDLNMVDSMKLDDYVKEHIKA